MSKEESGRIVEDMKLGTESHQSVEGMTFEEVVDFAAENGLECLEVACWPQGGAQR